MSDTIQNARCARKVGLVGRLTDVGVASIILCKADGGLTGIEAEWKRATAAC
jgi:hypothetical protein